MDLHPLLSRACSGAASGVTAAASATLEDHDGFEGRLTRRPAFGVIAVSPPMTWTLKRRAVGDGVDFAGHCASTDCSVRKGVSGACVRTDTERASKVGTLFQL